MEKTLERAPMFQAMGVNRIQTASLGAAATSAEISQIPTIEVPEQTVEEIKNTRYAENVVAGLQLNGDVQGHNLLGGILKNMGMPYAQKGRRNNVDLAVRKLAELEILTIPENGHLRKSGEVKLTALGRAYEVDPEIIEEIKTSSADQNT